MSDKPLIFTEQEQINLRDLENSGNELVQFKNIVLKGSYPGQDSSSVFRLVNFLESLIQQTSKQINLIKDAASARANAPAVVESSEQPKDQ